MLSLCNARLHRTDCSLRRLRALKALPPSRSLAPAAKAAAGVHHHYLPPQIGRRLRCPADCGGRQGGKAMCVCLTRPWSVKQRLNLCKQALALLPNCLPACLPAVWAGARRGLIPWHGRGSHMLTCVCLCAIMPKTQAEG